MVPGSGGKDSAYTSHVLKYKYGMNPLTVTWAPHLYTDIGWENFQNWMHEGALDNILFTPNGKLHRKLTQLAFHNFFTHFRNFFQGEIYATTSCSDYQFCSAIRRENVVGYQFHPEKSSKSGVKLIQSFFENI